MSGSSPHTRGALGLEGGVPGNPGIIPAYAGSTPGRVWPGGRRRDHPRIRGEHPRPARLGGGSTGIIPAYAGSTTIPISIRSTGWDHPRIRGEHVEHPRHLRDVVGSSPHTRGARVRELLHRLVQRIIPAYAGSTSRIRRSARPVWDHPRIRGEHPSHVSTLMSPKGSSPHTRGAQGDGRYPRRRVGIIPAYAGSTESGVHVIEHTPDHPRIRGEHLDTTAVKTVLEGSSPHTRGARFPFQFRELFSRIIPAYAGSTPIGRSWRHTGRDHPRIRGEHPIAVHMKAYGTGSSPHTRGAPPTCPRRASR